MSFKDRCVVHIPNGESCRSTHSGQSNDLRQSHPQVLISGVLCMFPTEVCQRRSRQSLSYRLKLRTRWPRQLSLNSIRYLDISSRSLPGYVCMEYKYPWSLMAIDWGHVE